MIGTTHHVSLAPLVSVQSTAFITASMEIIEMKDIPINCPESDPEFDLADKDRGLEGDRSQQAVHDRKGHDRQCRPWDSGEPEEGDGTEIADCATEQTPCLVVMPGAKCGGIASRWRYSQ